MESSQTFESTRRVGERAQEKLAPQGERLSKGDAIEANQEARGR